MNNLVDGDVKTKRVPHFHHLETLLNAIGAEAELSYFKQRFHLAQGQYMYRCGVVTLSK
jgi:hypothetical protein